MCEDENVMGICKVRLNLASLDGVHRNEWASFDVLAIVERILFPAFQKIIVERSVAALQK